MRIQIIAHTEKKNLNKLIGRWSLLPFYFKKFGNEVSYILRDQWPSFFYRYKKFKPDIIITSGPISALVIGLKKVGLIKIPIVHDWNDNYAEIMGKKWGKSLIGFIENYTIKKSDLIVTPSRYRLEKARRLGKVEGKNLFYISHGVRDNYFKRIKKIKLPGRNKIKVLYSGEQSRVKRVDKLIKSMSGAKADLILVGQVDPKLKEGAPSNAYFIEQKPINEMPSYLKSADFLVVTEDNDSALKLIEYLAVGKPVLVPQGRISRYFKSDNFLVYSSFNQISLLLKNKERFNPGKVTSWEEIAGNYMTLLKKAI